MTKAQKEQPLTIAVGGGKGGVGKSVVTANLATALAQRGKKVVLVDTDLGAANMHILFDLMRPEVTLVSFLRHEVESLADAVQPTCIPNLGLVAGAGAVPGVANINYGQKTRLLGHIKRLEADVVVLDIGAGTSHNVVDFYDIADYRLVVMTPQVTSLTNAYAFIKSAVYRVMAKLARAADRKELIPDGSTIREVDRVGDMLGEIQQQAPPLAGQLRAALDHFGCCLVVNMLRTEKEVKTVYAISRMARDFLTLEAPVIGSLWKSNALHRSVDQRRPFLAGNNLDSNALTLRKMAEMLLDGDYLALREGRQWTPDQVLDQDVTTATEGDEDQDSPVVDDYVELSKRHEVDWNATALWEESSCQVRVLNVSMVGALVEGDLPLAVGSQATLLLPDLDGAPEITVAVRNQRKSERLSGLEFIDGGEIARQLVEASETKP